MKATREVEQISNGISKMEMFLVGGGGGAHFYNDLICLKLHPCLRFAFDLLGSAIIIFSHGVQNLPCFGE